MEPGGGLGAVLELNPCALWGRPPLSHILSCAGGGVLQIFRLQKALPSLILAQLWVGGTFLSVEQRGQLRGGVGGENPFPLRVPESQQHPGKGTQDLTPPLCLGA